jgi:acetoacetyl-CoA synthetase
MATTPTSPETRGEILRPVPEDARRNTRLGRLVNKAEDLTGQVFPQQDAFTRWSVEDPDSFWRLVASELSVRWHTEPGAYLVGNAMPGARWCPDGTLNYAEHSLAWEGPATAVIARSQTRPEIVLSRDELREQVRRCAAGLRVLGVGRGDRVAGYLPNIPEALIAMLATASLGALWASCPPEFGVRSVVDRLGQVAPDVLLVADGYRWGGKEVDRSDDARRIIDQLPPTRVVRVPYLRTQAEPGSDETTWGALLAEDGPLEFQPVPFETPLYALFSSGTTGKPKPILHGHGGMTLEHLKAMALMQDVREGDRFYWYSTTGWVMWNILVSGLTVGASIVLFDGDPGFPDLEAAWKMAAETGITHFGTSAGFLMATRRSGVVPREAADLSKVRFVGSTGAPLPAAGFRWVYDAIATDDLLLSSISGGTDVATAFVGGSPLLPVRAGEISGAWPGCDVRALDEHGTSVTGQSGELVIGTPMPSMPVGFLGDADGSRYRAAYFEHYPGLWRHGDWVTIHDDGAVELTGRSDATLNRGGVRIGTAELYSVVEDLDDVADSLVIHLEDDAGGPGQLLLFVVPATGIPDDPDALQALQMTISAACSRALREELSPRHVPDALHLVGAVPRTLSGKKLEVPVKRILNGASPDDAASTDSLSDPDSLDPYVAIARRRAGTMPTEEGSS